MQRLMILNAVWEKEIGYLSDCCSLSAVKDADLLIEAESSAASHELTMRSREIIKGLNKYFDRPWIRSIKISTSGGKRP